jgi:hypothetical protein
MRAIQTLIEQQPRHVQKILKSPAFASLIVDCTGISRFVEVIFRLAQDYTSQLEDTRTSLLNAMTLNPDYVKFFAKFVLDWRCARDGMLFAFGEEWAVNKTEGQRQLDDLCLNGVLHRLNGGATAGER